MGLDLAAHLIRVRSPKCTPLAERCPAVNLIYSKVQNLGWIRSVRQQDGHMWFARWRRGPGRCASMGMIPYGLQVKVLQKVTSLLAAKFHRTQSQMRSKTGRRFTAPATFATIMAC